ncbi:3-hydroxybutyryl-CoA dehydrogenase [Streptomyces sp. NPDC057718]|uniref:3-hydroxybutyryl-CoA dehydrogenase n=1 Tax=Streptomyces sp. NPDC057718 TaxID=3346225 RepID=UPI0036BCF940
MNHTIRQLNRVGVLGCGLMGSGIAEVCLRAGLDVVVAEATPQTAERGGMRITASLARAVERGKLTAEQRTAALGRLRLTSNLEDLADRQLVIEAVAEVPEIKREAFRTLDRILNDPDAVIASNTSSIPIIELASVTDRPHRVIGIHFFNPVPVQPLIELIPTQLTATEVVDLTAAFAESLLGKTVIQAPDRAGFVVNALLVPYLLSAVRMLESGHASAEDIDTGMELGCAHPMGPLRLIDMVGLDTIRSIAESLFEEYKEPLYATPPLLQRMVSAGLLGRKSGQGFYRYQ